jgi:hypothetical protein
MADSLENNEEAGHFWQSCVIDSFSISSALWIALASAQYRLYRNVDTIA